MWSSAPSQMCRCPFSNSLMQISSTNYTHTMSVGTPEPLQPNAELKVVSVELQIQEWYKLYVEPTRGYRMLTMEEDYLVSLKFSCKFKITLFLSTCKLSCNSYVNGELDKLLISPGLAQYLKPFIVNDIVELAQKSLKEFKLVFDVKVVKIDLVNNQECDNYRRCGLV